MTNGFIDGATITSALTYLNQGKSAAHPLWHQSSILETTYLLLQEDMSIVPRPAGLGGEYGDYAIIAEEMSGLIVDTKNRKEIFEKTFQSVNNQVLDETNETYKIVKFAWEAVYENTDFLDWAEVQRVDRWENQSFTYRALFDKESISLISHITGCSKLEVRRIHRESGDIRRVEKWKTQTETNDDAKIANASWIIGGFMRGFFYDNLAANEGLHLLTHPFRNSASTHSDLIEQYEISNTLEILSKLLIANALNEGPKKRRVRTWANSVKRARDFIQKSSAEYPKLVEPSTHSKAVERALMVAREIDLEGNSKRYRYLIDAGLSLGLWGFGISPWVSVPLILICKDSLRKSPGEYIGDRIFKSNFYYKWLANSIPGRVERTLPVSDI